MDSTKESSAHVAQTAKQEVSRVAGEAKSQAQSLSGQARSQVSGKVEEQKSKAVGMLRTTADELHSLSREQEQSTMTTELIRRTAEQAQSVAGYLDKKGAPEIIEDVRSFARRRPGVFLLAAAVAGAVAGRIVKGAMAASHTPAQHSLEGTQYPRSGGYTNGASAAYEPVEPYETFHTAGTATPPRNYPGTTSELGQHQDRGEPLP